VNATPIRSVQRRVPDGPRITYLAFVCAYARVNGHPPAEADLQRYRTNAPGEAAGRSPDATVLQDSPHRAPTSPCRHLGSQDMRRAQRSRRGTRGEHALSRMLGLADDAELARSMRDMHGHRSLRRRAA
jgi:hypothetical protein